MENKDRLRVLGKRAPDGVYDIPLLGEVGYFGFQGEDLIRELMYAKPSKVRFVVYSPGGAVYDAIAVVGYLQANGIESYTEIYGYCASAATVFAAHSGPKNTAIAPGSMFLVHMPFHADGSTDEGATKAIDNATAFLQDLYMKSYGWSKAEAKKHMEASDGNGIPWTAAECKKLGIASEIMEGAKVAARYNINTTAMADTKKIKAEVTVKLGTMEAARAAFGEGTAVEVEIDADEVTAKAIAEKEATIAQLTKEVADLKAAEAEAASKDADIEIVKKEVAQAKAELTTATEAHTKAMDELKAAHAAEIAKLKAPVEKPTVANNKEPVATAPSETDKAAQVFAKALISGMTPLQRAQYDKAVAAKKG